LTPLLRVTFPLRTTPLLRVTPLLTVTPLLRVTTRDSAPSLPVRISNYSRCGGGVGHTVEYDPSIKSQLSSILLTLGPYVVQIWSRSPQKLEAMKPSNSTVWWNRPEGCRRGARQSATPSPHQACTPAPPAGTPRDEDCSVEGSCLRLMDVFITVPRRARTAGTPRGAGCRGYSEKFRHQGMSHGIQNFPWDLDSISAPGVYTRTSSAYPEGLRLQGRERVLY